MEKKEYSVVEFIQHLKDKPYIKLNIATRLTEIKLRKEMRIWQGLQYHKDRDKCITYKN